MIRFILKLFGYKIVYIDVSGYTYDRKYDTVDRMGNRPIHKNMSVAPPWAKLKIIRNKENGKD